MRGFIIKRPEHLLTPATAPTEAALVFGGSPSPRTSLGAKLSEAGIRKSDFRPRRVNGKFRSFVPGV
jgi:hypothetical protein